MDTEAQLLALIALLVGAIVFLAKRPVRPVAPVAPVAPILPLAPVRDWALELERIDEEIVKLREWRHNVASEIGAVAMLPALMRNLATLRERIVRLEARLNIHHDEGDRDA